MIVGVAMGRFQMRYAESVLERWGRWIETHQSEQHGLPKCDNVYQYAYVGRGGSGGHRILCAEMPKAIWWCNYHVIRLPPSQKEAVHAWYVYEIRPDGSTWNSDDKAKALGISVRTLYQRIHKARRRLADLL